MTQHYIGFRGYLVPRLLTAPHAAYQQPAVTVVQLLDCGRLLVELPDGSTVETAAGNVVRQLPAERAPRRAAPQTSMPDGIEEPTLF